MAEKLAQQGAGGIKVFGGGGGVIVPDEILELERSGVEKIYSPEDGQSMGLLGMIQDMIDRCKSSSREEQSGFPGNVPALENGQLDPIQEQELLSLQADQPAVVLGITGTGGALSHKTGLIGSWQHDYSLYDNLPLLLLVTFQNRAPPQARLRS